MKLLERLREFIHFSWFEMWSQVFMGEMLAATKPRTDLRR